jgi:formyltetrahydrofolate deformylase
MVILIQCSDRVGLVADITRLLAERKLNIVAMREYVDVSAGRFFARLITDDYPQEEQLSHDLRSLLPEDASFRINPQNNKKVVVMVTKEHHCLSDILVRNHFGTLGATIQCVVGNHATLSNICHMFRVPFFLVSHEGKERDRFEEEIWNVIAGFEFQYIVLAKFMRILSPSFTERLPMGIINIHHSFLPAFVGANPYKQAHMRGVKIIGATAHFVTSDLDQGPIIEQQIIPVNHTYTPADMVKAGMEVEKGVLARALISVFEDRVFVYNNKTVVFD